MGRLKTITSPLQSIYREITVRYAGSFGLDSLRKQPLQAIKAITLVRYFLQPGILGHKASFQAVSPVGPLLAAVINALLLALINGQKRPIISFISSLL